METKKIRFFVFRGQEVVKNETHFRARIEAEQNELRILSETGRESRASFCWLRCYAELMRVNLASVLPVVRKFL